MTLLATLLIRFYLPETKFTIFCNQKTLETAAGLDVYLDCISPLRLNIFFFNHFII